MEHDLVVSDTKFKEAPLPCPVCGNDKAFMVNNIVYRDCAYEHGARPASVFLVCKVCGRKGMKYYYCKDESILIDDNAVSYWNNEIENPYVNTDGSKFSPDDKKPTDSILNDGVNKMGTSWFKDKFLGGDYTPLEHAFVAALLYFGVSLMLMVFGTPKLAADLCGAGVAIAAFFGREHAQAEAKYRKQIGERAVLKAFLFWKWDWPSQMDLYCPVAVAVILWLSGV